MLLEDVSLGLAPDILFELISYMVGGERKAKAKALAQGEDPDGDCRRARCAGGGAQVPRHPARPEAFVESLEALQPRLYSISSSPKVDPNACRSPSITCATRSMAAHGSASPRPSCRAPMAPGTPLKVYIQRAHNFALPSDHNTPIIMVGPGTGVAPFRAFLHERMVTASAGRHLAVLRPSTERLRLLLRG